MKLGTLVTVLVALVLVPIDSVVSASPPVYSQSSNTYVAVGASNFVQVVNSASGQVVGTNISVGTDPVALAAVYPDSTASGQVLVLNQGSDNVSVISTSTNLVTTTISLPSGATPVSIAVDAVHYYALVVDTFSTQSSDEVTVISTATDSVVGSFSLGLSNSSGTPGQVAVLPGGSYAYVTDQTSHEVIALQNIGSSPYYQLESALSYTGSLSFDPVAIATAASGSTVYVSDVGGTGYVDYFPVIFGSLSSESSISLSLTPGALSMSFSGSTLYVQIPGTSKVDYVNTTSDTATTETTAVTAGPVAIADGGDLLAIGDTASSDVELVNSASATEQSDVSLVGSPTAMLSLYPEDVHFDAYVANYGSGTVSVLDLQADAVRQTLTVGTDPDAVATSPGGTKVYVANYGSSTVSVISTADIGTATNPVVATIALPSGSDPVALAVAPNADRLLVVDEGSGDVSVIDTNPNDGSSYETVSPTPIYLDNAGTQDAALDADSIAFGPDGTYAYVTDSGDKAVTVLSETSANTYSCDNLQVFSSFTTPNSVAISPTDETAYVTDSLGSSTAGNLCEFPVSATGSSIGQLKTSSGASITVGKAPDDVSLSPEGQTAYVANASSATVSVVNTSTSAVSSESATGAPGGVAATPDGSMYVESGGSGSNTVSVYSASSYSSLASISVGTTPDAIAVSPTLQTPAAGSASPSELAGGGSNASEAGVAQGSADVEAGGDTATQSYTTTLPDFDIPDIGLPLDLTQTYDSNDAATNGPLGYGWSFSYGMTLTQNAYNASSNPCQITVTQEDGSTVSFNPPNGWSGSCPTTGYFGPAWVQAKMWHESSCYGSDACWVETRVGGTQYKFDANPSASVYGELVYETDKDGNTVTLAYSSGKLSTVTAASGNRSLSFTWTGSNITEIEDSLSRTATFSYTSGGQLSDVTLAAPNDPTSHHWHFTYYGSSPYRLYRWWSPNNEAAHPGTNAYATTVAYASGVITSVTEPEMTTECNGTSGTPLCSPETTFSYPSWDSSTDSGTVEISDPNENASLSDGRVTLDTYVEGLLASQVQGYGTGEDATAMTVSIRDPYTLLPLETMDADGYLTVTTRDSLGQALQVTDPLGRTTSYLYDDDGGVADETDAMSNLTVTAYNSAGDETSSTDPLGNATNWTYGSGAPPGLPHTMENALTGVTTYGYDAEGDLTSTTDPDGDVTTRLYDGIGELCASLTADGYAAGDRLGSSCPTSAAAYETAYPAYDVFGNNLEKITPTNAAGGTWQYAYDADGNQTSVANPDSNTTTYTYDADDNKLSQALPVETSGYSTPTTFSYDADGQQVTTVDPDGNVHGCSCAADYTTTLAYNDLAQKVSSTDPYGDATTYSYDPEGNILKTTTAQTGSTSLSSTSTFDADNELLTSTDHLGEESTYGYNADGEQDCASDANAYATAPCPPDPTGRVSDTTTTTYTADSQVATSTDPLGDLTTNYYDTDDNVIAVTNPDGNPSTCNPLSTSHCAGTTYYIFDTANRNTSMTTPPTATSSTGKTTSYTSDADGNQNTITDPLGQVATYSYDGLDELTGTTYTSSLISTPNVTYEYSNEGLRKQMVDGTGTTTDTYDADDRLTQTTDGAGAVDTYGYDPDSNTTCVTYPGTTNTCTSPGSGTDVVSYTYDDDNRVSTISDWNSNVLTYSYDDASEENQISVNSGSLLLATSYDQGGRVTSIDSAAGSNSVLELTYTRDADGNILTEQPTVGTSAQTEEQFQNNADDQVTSFTLGTASALTLTYGADGEITTNDNTLSLGTAEYFGYDGADEACWSSATSSTGTCSSPPSGATRYSYNSDGQRISATPSSGNDASYGWNATNNLVCNNTSGTSCSTSSPTSATTVYTYDGDGLRSASTIGSTTTDYTWGQVDGAAVLLTDGTADYIYDGHDVAPIEQFKPATSTSLFMEADPSGSVHGLIRLTGSNAYKLANYTDYDPYGIPTNTGGLTQTHTGINSLWNATSSIGYAGSYNDPTGLVYMQQRYYDPSSGQFVSLNPALNTSDAPYVYTSDDPVVRTDPSGAQWQTQASSVTPGEVSTGWSSVGPSDMERYQTSTEPELSNGDGCKGYFTGDYPQEMQCKDTSTDIYGNRVAIRWGYWNGSTGFGWSKALYLHNLWMQPMIDTIRLSTNTEPSPSNVDYLVYHYQDGTINQVVTVVSDNVKDSFGGTTTQDNKPLGVVTGYCQRSPTSDIEPECPDWVDTTL